MRVEFEIKNHKTYYERVTEKIDMKKFSKEYMRAIIEVMKIPEEYLKT